jgi:hypothetical protein
MLPQGDVMMVTSHDLPAFERDGVAMTLGSDRPSRGAVRAGVHWALDAVPEHRGRPRSFVVWVAGHHGHA